MMNFRDFITESVEDHKHGTYISVKPDKLSKDALRNWAITNKIPNPLESKDLHCTVIYSRKGIPEAKHYDMELPINAKTSGLKIFKQQNGKNCVVVTIKSEDLSTHHDTIMDKYGATYDFDSYIPHITLSYDIGDLDIKKYKFPVMDIVFDDYEFTKLDEPSK